MPFTIGMTGCHERQLGGKISKPRWRLSINRCLALATNAILVQHQQVRGSFVTDFDPASGWCVDTLRHDPVLLLAVPLDRLDWRNLDSCTEEIASGERRGCEI